MRRLVLKYFPFYVCGIIIFNFMSYILFSAVMAALFLILCIKKYKAMGIFIVIFVMLGMFAAFMHTEEFNHKYSRLSGLREYQGYVIDRNENSWVVKNYKENYKVILTSYEPVKAEPGDYITFEGKVQDKPSYKKNILNSMGIDAYIKASPGNVRVLKTNNVLMIPTKLKYSINNALISIDHEGGSFVGGLITGYTGELSKDIASDFVELGISHVLALSGFNLGIIFYLMLRVTKKLDARKRYLITLVICFIYTAVGGFEPSIFRAFLMIFIAVLGKLINRFYDIPSGITLAAMLMLTINSFYIYNIGFLLSFSATYGIVLLSKDIEDRIPGKLSRIKEELGVAVAAFLTTLPILIYFKGYFSIFSLFINIVISPFIGIETMLSFFSVLLYLIFKIKFILYPAVFLGSIFIKIMNNIAQFNVMVFPGSPHLLFLITYFLLLGIYFGYIKVNSSKFKRNCLYVLLVFVIGLTLTYHTNSMKVHFINVGQGESIFIETPDREGILIDTGPKLDNFSALRDRVIPYIRKLGFNSIDLLIFTHFHNDHAGDYQFLLDNYRVGKAIAYRKPEGTNYRFTEVSRGDNIKVGEVNMKILYPEREGDSGKGSEDMNETCLVMEVTYRGFSMLLTGDAEKSVMDLISGKYDVFNVSHHGSIKSFSTKMLDSSEIGEAVIAVGKNNFGHPSRAVLDYLSKRKIKTYRTDIDGNITVETNGENYETLFQ